MASVAASGIIATAAQGSTLAIPYVGWAIGLAAAYIDTTVIYPKLAGEPDEARFPQFASLPVSEQGPGAPRTFAIGARMRVPVHAMYQSSKAREEGTGGGSKGGTNVSLRRVFVNALLHLNDRETDELLQLIGNGQLILFNERNLIGVTSENLSAAVTGSDVTISLADEFDPDFRDTFAVGDLVLPLDFVRSSGPTTFNGTYYEVTGVIGATPTTGSQITVEPVDGQSITSLSYSGGTPFSPASLRRVDDAIGGSQTAFLAKWATNTSRHHITNPTHRDPGQVFQPGDKVIVRNLDIVAAGGTANVDVEFTAARVLNGGAKLEVEGVPSQFTGVGFDTTISAVSGKTIIVDFAEQQSFTTGVFPQGFDPEAEFNDGRQTQGQPAILLTDYGSGETSNYRGMATQGLEECYVSGFGDQLPTNLEAIIGIDGAMTWPQALEAILQRGDLLNTQIDASEVSQRPFRGAFVRGVTATMSQVQPLLVAGQVLGQDRNGVVHLFDADQADSVQLENGTALSDFGTSIDGQGAGVDKVQMEDKPEADMPTSIGVRFQDPDAAFSIGYEHFGLRNPEGIDHTNEQTMDLSSMVLTRREARNLTTTLMRRAWVNRRTYRMTLPAAYLHLLENDLITWTDDEGIDHTARIIQRDIGANFLVNITAVAELTALAVAGSPVQTSSTVVPQQTSVTATLLTVAIDGPAIDNAHITTPGVMLAVADLSGTLQSATVWESKDSGTYAPQGVVGSSAAVGLLGGTLSQQDPSEEYGTTTVTLRSQTVDVIWLNEGTEALAACTQAQAEAGQNWCALVSTSDPSDVEIAAWTTISANVDGSYTLGGWLRGLRGTSGAARDTSYYIVMLNQSIGGLFFREFVGPTPSSLDYKVVPAGGALETTTATSFSSPVFGNVLPLPVRKITRTYSATTGTRFEVEDGSGIPTHWERTVLPLGTQPPHTLDEPFEAYKFTIYRGDAPDTVFDTYTLDSRRTGSATLRDRYFDFGDTRATSAGYTPGPTETYTIGIQQIGQYGSSREIKDDI
jgi:hypothetical protein